MKSVLKKRLFQPKRTYGVRLDADMAKRAKKLGINIGKLLRITLARAITRLDGKCSQCGVPPVCPDCGINLQEYT